MISAKKLIEQSDILFGTSGARGLVEQFTPEVCYAFTAAFVKALDCDFSFQKVAIAIDNRPSSYAMAKSISAMIKSLGYDPVFFGVVPTPALAYYALQIGVPCIMVTGSHIPFDRNGLKFYRPDGEISKADELKITLSSAEVIAPEHEEELSVQACASNMYFERCTRNFCSKPFYGKRVGVYEHSSAGREIYKSIFKSLGADVISLGRSEHFVPIDTEAVTEEDKLKAKKWTRDLNLDAIFSTDGDGDRPLISDEYGNWIRGDVLGLVTAMYLGAKFIAAPVNCTTAIESSHAFRKVVRTKIGSPYVVAALDQADTFSPSVGFEANGGFLLGTDCMYAEDVFHALPTRDAMLSALVLFYEAWSKQLGISDIIAQLPKRYTASDRVKAIPREHSLNLIEKLASSKSMIIRLQEALSIAGVLRSTNNIDGFRMHFANNEIIHLRASGNAPELRCYAEADSQSRADTLVKLALVFLTHK
ncbi:phosphomannomutase [Pseudoalteromonas luteoviolacea]|uniref:Phosphomannomutase n=1 Tax=Pseudoalteromonas luteoviolacea S4060-1 TaxID=1365257 RepID=A0A167NLW9_9GAMM|nr:phosphomannomutase [Pseudoalteromonas luteoviolacea]KZN68472.1 hypothetical protein N478_15015 [Pseudoalteromonas luteoviolacea S4060-1]